MNTQKYKMENCGLLAEADRSMYRGKDAVSKSIIDKDRTRMNYNLCPHEQYTAREIRAIHEKIRGKAMPKNGVAWGSTIISLPRDYTGDTKAFFEAAYEGMKKMYKLRDDDVVSAYVHMDETTPHMHFYFLPIVHEQDRDRVSWETVMPRKMYKTQHAKLQEYMSEKLNTPVNLLNGETIGIDVSHMDAEDKKASMELAKKRKEIHDADDNLDRLQNAALDMQGAINGEQSTLTILKTEINAKKKEMEALEVARSQFKGSLDAWVSAHHGLRRILNASPWLSDDNRDRLEHRMEQAVERGKKAIAGADDVDSLLAAAAELERGRRIFDAGKTAAKENLDVDELIADDDFGLD